MLGCGCVHVQCMTVYALACVQYMYNGVIMCVYCMYVFRVQFGGLGQLFDGVLGGNDFTETKELRVWPGYDYLGWSREALGQGSVDIEFHFEKTRSFHTMQVRGCMCVCVCLLVCRS
ncbi:unnamed protein product [Oncorhynchus mykiss]|uniref:Discoidin domain-containing protein n=1 Tax=Oncorhynchus mykiss TaxID=8022 RepID=A0A060WCD1_ONCMY|nr:unnamed protein product [Oncorhynchus mykiss]